MTKKISTSKPVLSRFGAAKIAAGEKPAQAPKQPEIIQAPEAPAQAPEQAEEKAAPLRKPKQQSPTVRENFDVEEDLRNEMRLFIAGSRMFRTKRDFLTQCLKDGLKKYKGK